MPITLPPISRRRFLTSTLAAGAGALLPRELWALADERAIDRIALLADTHIAADPTAVRRDVNMAANLRAIATQILAMERKPSAVMIAGDIALASGQVADYQTVVELLRPLREGGLPVHLGMGNHDNRERFRQTLAKDPMRQAIATPHEVLLIERPNADWIMLDSLQETKVTAGRIGDAQLAWLGRTLDERPQDKPVILMVHHPPLQASSRFGQATRPSTQQVAAAVEGGFNGLLDSEALMDVILPRRQVKLLLFGHTHQWFRGSIDGLHLINLPTSAYVFTPAQTSGWVDCRIAAGGGLLRINCLDEKHALHGVETRLEWRS